MRNSNKDDAGAANPVYRPDNLAIIEGSSQSGRMIRSLLALGFNGDEAGRRVVDGAFPYIGGGLMPLNVRFGQPLRAWGEQTDHLYPAYDFPFTYARETDPLTQRTGGMFDRCRASDTCPKLFHIATALEMWEGRQSLWLTDPLGRVDVTDPPNVRTYIMASTQVFLQAPIGTYMGWNLGRNDRFENGMCNLQGSFIPFAATKAERVAVGDPRLSIEERYPTKEAYLAAFRKAANDLVARRFLLPNDADSLIKTSESDGVWNAP